MRERLQFRDQVEGNPAYEPVYFKGVGEKTAMQNEQLFNQTGGFDPVYVPVSNGLAEGALINSSTNERIDWSGLANTKSTREPRLVNFSYLTAAEASRMASGPLAEPFIHVDGDRGC